MLAADEPKPEQKEPKLSEERLLDAEAIEAAAKIIDRPTARAHLESLAQKLRRDGAALKRVEASRAKADSGASMERGDEAVLPLASTLASSSVSAPVPAPFVPPKPVTVKPMTPPDASSSAKYHSIDRFSFDAGGYNSDKVTVYVPLPGVGGIPRDNITCEFTPTTFDLVVLDLGGKNYRLVKDNLDKDIDPKKSKCIVKADKIVLKLGKCKTEYGSYEHWSDLTAKKAKKKTPDGKSAAENPTESIMNLMKDMYDEGDDKMKKMIGETMWKQRTGQLDSQLDKDKYGLGGMDEDF